MLAKQQPVCINQDITCNNYPFIKKCTFALTHMKMFEKNKYDTFYYNEFTTN